MRTPLVAGNWKLNGTREANARLLRDIQDGLGGSAPTEVMVCPPFVYLAEIAQSLRGSAIMLGAQNVAAETSGAYTGEISAAMLRDVGCTHVIVGHSERRAMYGETDEIVMDKFRAARAVGLVPILCVGETLVERRAGSTMQVVSGQIGAVLQHVGVESFADGIVAYEPVWAIGTGQTATPDQAQEVHANIRATFASADAKISSGLRILYGGSVKGANAADLFAMDDIDGGLIGGASLDSDQFLAICHAASG
jgi:triosephosphate isomerase